MSTWRCYSLKVGEKTVYWYIFDGVSQVYINRDSKFIPANSTGELIPDTRVAEYFATSSQLYITLGNSVQNFADRTSQFDITF